jgi:hypothetical protein
MLASISRYQEDPMTDQSAPGDVIRLDDVTKTYQAGASPALAGVSLDVAAGEVVARRGRGPASFTQVFPPSRLALLALAGPELRELAASLRPVAA